MKSLIILLALIISCNTFASAKIEDSIKKLNWNGVDVVFLEDNRFPTYDILIYFADGALSDGPKELGISNHAFNLGYNVLQIFFEDNPKIIQRKHITLWTKVHPDELTLKKDEVMSKVKTIKESMENKLILRKLPSDTMTMLQIKNQIRKMIADGTKIDMVLLDYIDCVVPDKNLGDEWKSEGSVMRGFEAMCHELNLVGWTATQGNRSSISSEVVTTDQMGGSIKKAQVGHVIISVAKTLQQKEMKLATIAITKSRIGDDGVVFENCKFDNGMLEIDTESSVTFLGLEEQNEERNRQRIKDLLDKRKQREEKN